VPSRCSHPPPALAAGTDALPGTLLGVPDVQLDNNSTTTLDDGDAV
jgi:hypothetical protein